ncbi:MAG: SMC-Scp complex subunit ScpB, partial [Rhodocyclaceae bacterium]|nr:SMC-Scp complex subunit ScpB [Rhodocyclaceae bacterium]
MQEPSTPEGYKRVLEAALLSASAPRPVSLLRRLFADDPGPEMVRRLLDELRQEWRERSVELVQSASGWRFQTRAEMQVFLDRLKDDKPPRYSRAVLETLA